MMVSAPQLCSLSYVSVDDAVCAIWRLGVGTVLAKFDLESAYRQIPVHPQDRRLLGVMWGSQCYVDRALPFGFSLLQRCLMQWWMPYYG